MMKRLLIIAALAGCVHSEQPMQSLIKLRSGPVELVLPKQKPILGLKGVRHDLVTLTSGEKTFTAEGLISSDENKLNIIVFSGVFGKLLQISVKDGNIAYDVNDRMPKEFKPEFLLVDLLMIIGSDAEVQSWLGENFEIRNAANGRFLLKNGQVLSLLEKSQGPGAHSALTYENRYFGYSLKIESIHDN